MIDEKYLSLFIGLLRYPGIDDLEVRDAFLNVLYGTIPDGVTILCDTPTFCAKLVSYTRQCDKAISIVLEKSTGIYIENDSEFRALARFVVAGLDAHCEGIEKSLGRKEYD